MTITEIPYIPCSTTNYTKGRTFQEDGGKPHPLNGHTFIVDSIALHRTAITGDTAEGECHHYTSPNLQASFHEVIGTDGKRCKSVGIADRAWAVIGGAFSYGGHLIVDSRLANYRTKSIELCGPNGTALTAAQITAAIQAIEDSKQESPAIVLSRLSQADLAAGKAGLYNHRDATQAFKIQGGHQDFILDEDWVKIIAGLK